VSDTVCPMLADGRATVRANALAALAAVGKRCGADGRAERKLLSEDASDLVRANAARVLTASPSTSTAAPAAPATPAATPPAPAPAPASAPRPAPASDDRVVLDRCAAADRSAEVARRCRPRPVSVQPPTRRTQAVTVFVVGESAASTARPRSPFLLEYADGVLRAGIADRRGATFDPAAPAGEVVLRRVPTP
jgi:hypothetical protein